MSRDWPAPAYRFSPPSCCCCCSRFLSLGRGGGISRTGLLRRHRPVTQPRGLGVSSGELGPSCLLSLRSAHARCDQNIETQPRLSREGTPGPSCPLFFVLRDSGCCCSRPANWRTLLVSRLHCTQCVMGSPRPQVILQVTGSAYNSPALSMSFYRVSSSSSVYFLSQTIVRLVPLPLWCLTPRPRRRRRQRQSEPEPEWSVRACYQPGPGNIISASRPAGGRAAGDKENQAPDDFITSAASDWGCDLLWVRDDNRETLAWYQMSLSPLSVAEPGPAPRVTVRARPPIQGSFFLIFSFVQKVQFVCSVSCLSVGALLSIK